ncbi:hypothetical protein ANCDUO_26940 [Ancylostoma duodenale]|uniref:Uncharacterized protein n=1 Tax=Ancylostoma duodenale TaxID=51022 RepID=A0A0C2BH23_9BILA|nr:hypothetical protein ANCDUO_26940 [Ancylostoma duodenale]
MRVQQGDLCWRHRFSLYTSTRLSIHRILNNTLSLLHNHNEYLNGKVFLRGVEIYETLIDNLANVKA